MEAQKDTSVTHSPTLRKTTTDNTKPRVMFTGVVDEQGEKVGCLVYDIISQHPWAINLNLTLGWCTIESAQTCLQSIPLVFYLTYSFIKFQFYYVDLVI